MKSNEQKAWDYIEAVKLKLKSSILSYKAECLASTSPFSGYARAIEALENFGVEAGLIDEAELKKERKKEKIEKEKAAKAA